MSFFGNQKFFKILFAGFISGFFTAFIVLNISLSVFFPKKNKKIDESNLIAPYSFQKTFKPEILKTSAIPYSEIIEKSYRIPIITYHYIEYVKDPKDTIRQSLDIVPAIFEKELQALKDAKFQTIFVKDIPKIISGEIPYSSKSAVLTFDDGYEDFYTDAFPLLKKYKIKATIFVVNNFIGLKGFMNEKQLKEIVDSHLVEIGAHTLDHLYLKLLPINIVDKQVTESKKILEKTFKIKIESFAYPYGAFSQDTIKAIKLAGYTNAVSEISDVAQFNANLFFLSRIRAGSFSYGNIIRFLENYKK